MRTASRIRARRALPGVRLVTAQGLLVTTDAQGRYHIACPVMPDAALGSNFIVKLDERTLPSGYRLTTDNPETVRLTAGKVSKLNFGATIHHVVRIEVNDAAFDGRQRALRHVAAHRRPRGIAQGAGLHRAPRLQRDARIRGNDPGADARAASRSERCGRPGRADPLRIEEDIVRPAPHGTPETKP